LAKGPRPVRDPAIAFDVRPQPVVALPERPPPLLMDVTPHSLGIETAGGFVKKLIAKNAPVPTEQSRTFTTALDDQREVVVRVCQGEGDRFSDNQELGEVILDQLPPSPRGALAIDVAFILDADGTLAVEARDAQSGRVQRTRIQLRGGASADEIEAMRARHRTERFR
jgi:molecular chaperone DnaK